VVDAVRLLVERDLSPVLDEVLAAARLVGIGQALEGRDPSGVRVGVVEVGMEEGLEEQRLVGRRVGDLERRADGRRRECDRVRQPEGLREDLLDLLGRLERCDGRDGRSARQPSSEGSVDGRTELDAIWQLLRDGPLARTSKAVLRQGAVCLEP
jgi:hypothetical protein